MAYINYGNGGVVAPLAKHIMTIQHTAPGVSSVGWGVVLLRNGKRVNTVKVSSMISIGGAGLIYSCSFNNDGEENVIWTLLARHSGDLTSRYGQTWKVAKANDSPLKNIRNIRLRLYSDGADIGGKTI